MEPTAQCEVTVLEEVGRPLAGAVAVFSPNVLWAGNGSTVFADSLFNSEDMLCNAHQPDREMVRERTNNDFRARSDDRGVALVELPAGSQSYSVSHTNYEMPIQRAFGSPQRSGSVQLSAGETTRVVVKMQKKGTEALTH